MILDRQRHPALLAAAVGACALLVIGCTKPGEASNPRATAAAGSPAPAPISPVAAPATPSAPADPKGAVAVVRGFYALSDEDAGSAAKAGDYFTPDLTRALQADAKTGEDGPKLDFDIRSNSQDPAITRLTLQSRPDAGGARVTARFDEAGRPEVVDYQVVMTPAGWRISDVSAPAENGALGWRLSDIMELHRPADSSSRPAPGKAAPGKLR